jgi:hypothetical protein
MLTTLTSTIGGAGGPGGDGSIDRVIRTFRQALNFRGNFDDCVTCGGSIHHNVFHRGLAEHGWVLGFLTWHQCFPCAYRRPDATHYSIWMHLSNYRMIDLIFISKRASRDCCVQLVRNPQCSHVFADIKDSFYTNILAPTLALHSDYTKALWRKDIVETLKKALPKELAELVAEFRV